MQINRCKKGSFTPSVINGCFKSLLALIIIGAFTLAATAASITIDFRKLYTEEKGEEIPASRLLSFLNSDAGSPGIVSGISQCNLAYGYPNGLYYNGAYKNATPSLEDKGALFIKSTDEETNQDSGGITFTMAPQYRHRNTNIMVYVYLDDNSCAASDLDHSLEVSFNGGPYIKSEFSEIGRHGFVGRFNFKPEGAIIKDLSIRVPNVYRKAKHEPSDAELDYFMAITYINLYYGDETAEPVTDWRFEKTSDSVSLDNSADYEMPRLVAMPVEAADMVELSSSDPEVASIENGKVVAKKEGVTTIVANLAENNLFKASSSYSPASYQLTVKKSMSEIEEVSFYEETEEPILYDLQGRIVSGKGEPGVYILKRGAATKKIMIR